MIRLVALLILTGNGVLLQAQSLKNARNDSLIESQLFSSVPDSLIVELKDYLPPLPLLIDSAISNSPQVAYFEALVKSREYAVSMVRKDWASNISISGTFNGGNSNVLDESVNVTGTNYGARVNIPLSTVIGRKDRIMQAESMREADLANLRDAKIAVRNEVTELYNRIFLLQRKLIITNEARQQGKIMMDMAEKRFIEGDLSLDELGKNTELKAKYANLYEDQRTEFSNTYFSLQRLVGVPFSKFNLNLD